jgi:hypothetical protein
MRHLKTSFLRLLPNAAKLVGEETVAAVLTLAEAAASVVHKEEAGTVAAAFRQAWAIMAAGVTDAIQLPG